MEVKFVDNANSSYLQVYASTIFIHIATVAQITEQMFKGSRVVNIFKN